MTTPRPETAELLTLAVHEFRTPVTVIAGYLRMLAREQLGPLTDRQKAFVEEVERSCGRLSALVAEMSDLSALEAGTAPVMRDEVDLSALVDEVVPSLEEGRDRGVTISHERGGRALVIEGDRTRLLGVITSLCLAVLREQGEPATVVVRTGVVVRDGRAQAALGIGPGESARIALEDCGPGARLNEARGGLGLALPIARSVVEHLGGRIWSSGAERALGAVAVLIPLKEERS